MILDGFGLQGTCSIFLGYSTEAMISGTIQSPGQVKLKRSSVIVVGAGGLGCPALQYLAAAGVGEPNAPGLPLLFRIFCPTGTIGIVDQDVVESSNLQRQILHAEDRLGIPKAASAATAVKG